MARADHADHLHQDSGCWQDPTQTSPSFYMLDLAHRSTVPPLGVQSLARGQL